MTLPPISHWIIGRRYCAACDKVLTVVRHPGAEDLRCPRCEGPTVEACGDEAARTALAGQQEA